MKTTVTVCYIFNADRASAIASVDSTPKHHYTARFHGCKSVWRTSLIFIFGFAYYGSQSFEPGT
jgi:hypothetical protein